MIQAPRQYQISNPKEIKEKVSHDLQKIESEIKEYLTSFQNLYMKLSNKNIHSINNNQILIQTFMKVNNESFRPLQLILRFMNDIDIMNVAATCQTLYRQMFDNNRLIYSPLGHRIIRNLRPLTIYIIKPKEQKQFSQSALKNLCQDKSLVNLQEDDKVAIILTMKTNLLATKQKIRELEITIQSYQKKSQKLLNEINYKGGECQQQINNIDSLQEQIEKLGQLLKQSEQNISKLREQQEKMVFQRQNRLAVLQAQRQKLQRQKQLLIKKIKSQQKQRQENLVYAREVSRVINMLNKITSTKK